MNAITVDTPISYGLALEVLRGRRMEQVGMARRQLRELRASAAAAGDIELAEQALQDAREAVGLCQRMSDSEARSTLAAEGIDLCKS
ncbi:hypothetical protein ACVALR_14370 [Stenotrophomonas maltophilia]